MRNKMTVLLTLVFCLLLTVGCSEQVELPDDFVEYTFSDYEIAELNVLEEFFMGIDFDTTAQESEQALRDLNFTPRVFTTFVPDDGEELKEYATNISTYQNVETLGEIELYYKYDALLDVKYSYTDTLTDEPDYNYTLSASRESEDDTIIYFAQYTSQDDSMGQEVKSLEEAIQFLKYYQIKNRIN